MKDIYGWEKGRSTEVCTQSPEHAKTSMPRSRIMFRGLPLRRLPRQCAYRCFGTTPKSSRLRAPRPIDIPKVQTFRFQGKLLGSTPPGLPSETRARAGTSAVQDFACRPPYSVRSNQLLLAASGSTAGRKLFLNLGLS